MSEHVENSSQSEPRPKKRKLRYPRTSNACAFCRRRKVRCSGTQPCEVCVREEVNCEYASAEIVPLSESPRNTDNSRPRASHIAIASDDGGNTQSQPLPEAATSSRAASTVDEPIISRRASIDPPQNFAYGEHVGPTSGVSFLYHPWDRSREQEARAVQQSDDDVVLIIQAPLVSYGDVSNTELLGSDALPQPKFTIDQIADLVDRYFQYVSPTYRFLHHPTVKGWAVAYIKQESSLLTAQKACVLLVCAQTLLHSTPSPGDSRDIVGNGDVRLSMACAERARAILDAEPGPPSLASVQARIGMCLYLLSTFRLNECRYCFSFAATVATALGIHRRQSSTRVNSLEGECRKRTFWSAYILDGYLSVMLGRPRLLRDEDIDQPYPHNIDDHDLLSSEPIESLPLHGNLEAFVFHARLAKLCARNNDQLYPLQPLTYDQIIQRSNKMLNALTDWEGSLPEFLKPREKTLTGQRTFQRQNTILKLALAHVRILAARRCLLKDFSNVQTSASSSEQVSGAERSIRECIAAITTILDTVLALIEHGQCYSPFWSTQYIAIVAISTFYVLMIQDTRRALPKGIDSFVNVDDCLSKTWRCHDHLRRLPPPGSQAERHHTLLARLRSKADRVLAKRKAPLNNDSVPQVRLASIDDVVRMSERQENRAEDLANNNLSAVHSALRPRSLDAGAEVAEIVPLVTDPSDLTTTYDEMNDLSAFTSMLTPNSNSDSSFQFMLDFGWESLDAIGASNLNSHNVDGFCTL